MKITYSFNLSPQAPAKRPEKLVEYSYNEFFLDLPEHWQLIPTSSPVCRRLFVPTPPGDSHMVYVINSMTVHDKERHKQYLSEHSTCLPKGADHSVWPINLFKPTPLRNST